MPQSTGKTGFRTTRIAYLVPIVALVAVLISYGASIAALRSVATQTDITNAAGLLRALSQRGALLAHESRQSGSPAALEAFFENTRRFRATYETLITRDDATIATQSLPDELLVELQALQPLLDSYFGALQAAVEDPAIPVPDLAEFTRVLDELNRVVEHYESYSHGWISWLTTVSIVCGIVMIVAGAVASWVVLRRYLRPDELELARLFESNQRYNDAYQSSPVWHYDLDATGRIISMNQTFVTAMGVTREQLLGRSIFDFLEGGEDIGAGFDARDFIGKSRTVDRNFKTPAGRLVPVTIYVSATDGIDGNALARVLVIDRTAEVLARQEAQKAVLRRERTIEQSPIPMFSARFGDQINHANQRLLSVLQVDTIEQLKELELGRVVNENSRRQRVSGDSSTYATRESLTTAAGAKIDVLLYTTLVEEDDETLVEGGLVDVTELESFKQQLHDSRERFRRLYDETPVMLCSTDAGGFVTDINEQMIRNLGRERADFLDLPIHEVFAIDDRDRAREEVTRCLEEGAAASFEAHCSPIGSEQLAVFAHLTARRNAEHRIVGLHVTLLDQTDIAAAKLERDRIADRLRMAEKLEAVGQLAAGVAHEINTPSQYVFDNLSFICRSIRRHFAGA